MTADGAALPAICILAGGLGSRLGQAVADTPKPLMPIAGRPFLAYQLDLLAAHGAHEIVLSVGYLGEIIKDSIGDGSEFGLKISYSEDGPVPIGTAGAVRKALPLLGQRFMILYGDTYLRVDYAAVDTAALESRKPALMTVLKNEGRWDASNVEYADGEVVRYDKREATGAMSYIDYGLSVMTAGAMLNAPSEFSDLSDVFHGLANAGALAGYEAHDRFYEIGTPAALAETTEFLSALPI